MYEMVETITWEKGTRGFLGRAFFLRKHAAHGLFTNALKPMWRQEDLTGPQGYLIVEFLNGATWAYEMPAGTDVDNIRRGLKGDIYAASFSNGSLQTELLSPGQFFARKVKPHARAHRLDDWAMRGV